MGNIVVFKYYVCVLYCFQMKIKGNYYSNHIMSNVRIIFKMAIMISHIIYIIGITKSLSV